LLSEHGLGFYQLLDGENLKTTLFHIESGESIESTVKINYDVNLNSMNAYQVAGSAITYFRRYSLSCILGLITDKDIDAKGEEVKTPVKKAPAKPKVKQVFKEGGFKGALESDRQTILTVLDKYELTPDQRKQLTEKLKTAK
jgi:DNA helicase HerA-like ATPase